MEDRKRREYLGTTYEAHLIPFVMESTGRLGPAAKTFLDTISRHDPAARSSFLQEVSVILARGLGRQQLRSRYRLKEVAAWNR
jgi:hypothetical protein